MTPGSSPILLQVFCSWPLSSSTSENWRLSVLLKGVSGVAGEPGESAAYSLSKIRFSKLIKDSKHKPSGRKNASLPVSLFSRKTGTESHLSGCLTKTYSCCILKRCSYDYLNNSLGRNYFNY